MISVQRYEKLKADVVRLQRDVDRGAGGLAQLMKQLKSEFGCDTVEEAEKLLADTKKKSERAEREFAAELEEFEKEWGEALSGVQ